jgi:CoA:oxalate CoA-transferase
MRPFEGIRVVDITQVLAGPYAAYQLACLGADVIKVEQPNGGDQGRKLVTPTPESARAGMSALYTAVNGGKRSLTLDLKSPQAIEVIEKLIAQADVVVENFKAGTMERLGLGPERLRELNSSLVCCRISGYGQTGPRAGAAAYDPVIQAASGMMAVTGFDENGPTKVGFWVCDMATGMHAAFAVASALFRRSRTGEGEFIDVSMLDTAASMMSPMFSLFQNFGVNPPMSGNGSPASGGSSQVYPTQDGFLTAAPVTDAQFQSMMREVGRDDIADDGRFADRAGRLAHSVLIREAMVGALADDTSANWQKRFAGVGVAAGAVNTIAQAVDEPQFAWRETFSEMPGVDGVGDRFTAVNLGFQLHRDGPAVDRPPPLLGEHTDIILNELGYSAEAISALRGAGAV